MAGWKNIFGLFRGERPKAAETDIYENWFYWLHLNNACRAFYSDGSTTVSNENAYKLALSYAEIFFPIDAIADRVASLKYDIVDKNGVLKNPPKNIERLLESMNPMGETFSDLLYASVFSELADGNSYIYVKSPNCFSYASPDTISSLWVLRPDQIEIKLKTSRPRLFDITDISEYIDYYQIEQFEREKTKIDPTWIIHERSLPVFDVVNGLKSTSPLMAAQSNINNLIAVYQARYKVYANNGMGGILTKDGNNGNDIESTIDPITREKIINDILDRNGLTGDKNIWSISSIPLKFVKTLASIQELQPFEETREDALQLSGIYGVDKDLIPLKEGTTFNNKDRAEKNLYMNVIKGVAERKGKTFSKGLHLDKIGLSLKPNFDSVDILKEDKETSYKADTVLIGNIEKILSMNLIDPSEAKNIIDKITEKYTNG